MSDNTTIVLVREACIFCGNPFTFSWGRNSQNRTCLKCETAWNAMTRRRFDNENKATLAERFEKELTRDE